MDQGRVRRPRMLVTGMSNVVGGRESFLLRLAHSLRDDYEIWFLQEQEGLAYREELLADGVRIVRVQPRGAGFVRYWRALRSLMREVGFDVVWAHLPAANSIEQLLVAKQLRVPVRIAHSHGAGPSGSRFAMRLHHLQRGLLSKVATHLFACSDDAARWLFPGAEARFVANVMDARRFGFDQEAREALRAELGIGASTRLLIHVGRFVEVKNHAFDVEVLAALRDAGVDAEIAFCGDGPLRESVEERLRGAGLLERAHFLGVVDVAGYLSAADGALLPSFSEGLPYAALEAQAAQLPILVSDAVSRQAAVSHFARFLPLAAGPEAWARELAEAMRAAERAPGANPVLGTAFDGERAREYFLELLRPADRTAR